jgi:signal transduction histidine kinase
MGGKLGRVVRAVVAAPHRRRRRAGVTADVASGGDGLVGMRERAAVFGGELQAGAGLDGGFVVSATFPLNGSAR